MPRGVRRKGVSISAEISSIAAQLEKLKGRVEKAEVAEAAIQAYVRQVNGIAPARAMVKTRKRRTRSDKGVPRKKRKTTAKPTA